MSEIATLIEQDLSVASRCYFFGTTTLGGTDACRPEMQADGSIILRSLNLSHVAYRVTEEKYRELRQHPQRKVGMWDFIREDDQDADHIASATRYPQSAGRRIGDLERALVAKDAEIARLRGVLETIVQTNQTREFMGDDKSDGYGDQGWVVRDGQYAKIARAALTQPDAKSGGNADA